MLWLVWAASARVVSAVCCCSSGPPSAGAAGAARVVLLLLVVLMLQVVTVMVKCVRAVLCWNSHELPTQNPLPGAQGFRGHTKPYPVHATYVFC